MLPIHATEQLIKKARSIADAAHLGLGAERPFSAPG
jgi:hypothetical protein